MNRTRLLFIGFVALALGALVSYMVYHNLQPKGTAPAQAGVDVVLAANDIQVGARIEDKDVKVVKLPSGDLPPNYFRQKSQVTGRGVILPISRGDFLLPNKLAGEHAGSGLPSLIPPGMRAVSVRVNEVISVAGFVQPGTRVDVMLTGNPAGASEPQTTTVLENVFVIATGQRLERNSTGDPQMAAVITLLVSPDDAQKLALASSQGHIQLALRNPLDTRQEDLAAARAGSLYRPGSAPQPAGRPKPKRVAAPAPPPVPAFWPVEVIRGTQKDVTKF